MSWRYSTEELARITGGTPTGPSSAVTGVSTDTRTLKPGDAFFAIKGPNFDGHAFLQTAFSKGAAVVVVQHDSNGGPCIQVDAPLTALQAFAAAHRSRYKIPVLAITGSCGKTTSKEFIAAVLSTQYQVVKTQGNLNNDIGCPLSLFQIDEDSQMAIVEMGANHVGEIARLCTIAAPTESAITLIAEAHLEGFGSLKNVAEAKGEIVQNLGTEGTFYLNSEDEECVKLAQQHEGPVVRFGAREYLPNPSECDVVLRDWASTNDGELRLAIDSVGELVLPLHSPALITNVLLAVAVGRRHGIQNFEAPIREAYAKFSRITIHRMGPLEILDDSYNANPKSMEVALDALNRRQVEGSRIVAFGEMGELGDASERLHMHIGRLAGEAGVEHLFARGPHAYATINAARASGVGDARAVESHQEIAEYIYAIAQPGDVLLVKGSRGTTMEIVIEKLEQLYQEPTR